MPAIYAELVFGFVYGVGTDADPVEALLTEYLRQYDYKCDPFRVSKHLQTLDLGMTFEGTTFERMMARMTAGNKARCRAQRNDILAAMAVKNIYAQRPKEGEKKEPRPLPNVAHVVRSLKTPEEVRLLREVYRPGFFLIGIASDEGEQHDYLRDVKGLHCDTPRSEPCVANCEPHQVIQRDQDEKLEYGQRTRDTFYLADVFVELTGGRYKDQLDRFLELIFGHPFNTPTREEHAMFMAYASAARSAQLGRQVGAAIATAEGDVVSVGFNEVPAPAGGPYWEGDKNPQRDHEYQEKTDSNYMHRCRIVDSAVGNLQEVLLSRKNVKRLMKKLDEAETEGQIDERLDAISDILPTDPSIKNALHSSELKDITEYGRAVHAEMDALLTCARLGISVKGKRLFTTTFPCHNCTRHIIAAGLSSVTYIEPYPKSRAAALHKDAICFDWEEAKKSNRIPFLPFVGVGPRRYLDLFSLDLSTGIKIERKDTEGRAIFPKRRGRPPRVPMLPFSYLDREIKLSQEFGDVLKGLEGKPQ